MNNIHSFNLINNKIGDTIQVYIYDNELSAQNCHLYEHNSDVNNEYTPIRKENDFLFFDSDFDFYYKNDRNEYVVYKFDNETAFNDLTYKNQFPYKTIMTKKILLEKDYTFNYLNPLS